MSYGRIVLVVEDEPLLRMNAVDILEDSGFTALEARNADEAIEILGRRTDISAVFTDIEMPGTMNGLRLAAAVRDRWPPVEIIVTSGRVLSDQITLPHRAEFFPKPYDADRIVAALNRMLAGAHLQVVAPSY